MPRVQKSINHLTEELNLTLRNTLNAVTPLKIKNICHNKLAPWYTENTRALKQAFRWKEMALNQTGSHTTSLERQYHAVSKSPHC